MVTLGDEISYQGEIEKLCSSEILIGIISWADTNRSSFIFWKVAVRKAASQDFHALRR